MTTKYDVTRVNKQHPDWTAREIAEALGCCIGYVNATAKRNGLKIAKSQGGPRKPRPDSIAALGKAARSKGMTVAMINDFGWFGD